MKIYFAGSIRGGREDANLYLKIIKHLQTKGKVLTEHVGDKNVESVGEANLTDEYIHNRDVSWLDEADIVVAEVTNPSLGVGYEIRYSIDRKKKVLCLYRPQNGKRLSAMIAGCKDIIVQEYTNLEQAKKTIDNFF